MRKWWPLVAVCLGTFMFLLDTTVLSVALPDIGEGLSASLSALQWVANIYTLVLAVLMLTMGSLVDRFGARTVYVAGLVVFGIASLICGLAPNAGVLVTARGVQGIGGAAMAVTTFALIGSCYRGPDMGRAMGVFGAVTGLAAAVGPMLGGILTQYVSWRAVFFLNIPLIAVTAALSLRVLAPGRQSAGTRIDLPGMIAFALCAGSLTYAMTLAGEEGWTSPAVLSLLALAALALIIFARVELHSPAPLLDVRLFARASFSAVMMCVVASTAAFAALVYTSVWLQSGLGLGPVRAGLALMPLALASFATSLISGRRLHGKSPRAILTTGLLLSGIGCAVQTGLDVGSSASSLAAGLALTGVGVGLMGPAMGAAVFAALPPERGGMAAGAMTTFRQLGQTLGVAVFGVLFQQSGAALPEGLNRALTVAAAAGIIGSVLAYIFVPKPTAANASVPARRDLTDSR
ncbi:MFS transporter [Streptomyces sp. Je 1-4]|uniref:MFS transporter n=1 Tax=Streptomyces TaxID=1883 RepID=UPI0021D9EDED|nr:MULTISPECIES: MFS transporter [unclassified Streptomyces]UYB38940.1 MFS transporter [Streptomyces sp. Je 1-4]UZQ34934.1 MFS transporter [Streptomyces sp. Je 1-4] [Streptomyces sp. Je 1-4 4N24]UZQ42352.1 MFS transporter [Streptomyces sp. Je 1-4] [Streptomyces sp. Je 1-4 4N24_ara]